MKKHIYIILSLVWLLPLATFADGLVRGTVTLDGQTIEAEYYISGSTARLGSGYNACISQYSFGKVVVPYYIIVDGFTYPVTEISAFAFRRCWHVTEVTLPESIMRIGDFAFAGCHDLNKVSLPSTLTAIGTGAFIDLPALQRIDCYATTPPTWEYNDVFCFHVDGIGDSHSYHTDQVTLYVPACGLKLYRTTNYTNPDLGWTTPDGWGYFNHIEILDAHNYNFDVVFFDDGDWNEASNWNTGVVPQSLDKNVLIVADAVIPEGYLAKANEITFCGGSLTIKDGGQLVHNNAGVVATVEKSIVGFEQCSCQYLLASPVIDEQDPVALGMTNGDYNLYYFDQSEDPEWREYSQDTFNLVNGSGYLYSNEAESDIAFHGELNPATTDVTVGLAYDAEASLAGFNLVGNPYCCNAYITDVHDFYVLNDDGDEIVIATNAMLAPMQGVLLQATSEGSVTFTTTEQSNDPALTIKLSLGNGALCDRARIRLGEGLGLEKLQLNANHDKLYIPLEGKDYAVAFADTLAVMPLNLKVEGGNIYMLYFDKEGLTFEYLHLIDNLTDTDVDLLEIPYYTFNVLDTEFEDRFLVVFDPEGMDEPTDHVTEYEAERPFAFISNGEIRLSKTYHGASLQVIDMTGRIVVSKTGDLSGSISTSSMTSGVYVLRLINGSDVKTQKLVVE